MSEIQLPSPRQIEDAKTPAGAWTRATLESWGVSWPPPKGWRQDLEARHRALKNPWWRVLGFQLGKPDTLEAANAAYVRAARSCKSLLDRRELETAILQARVEFEQ